MHPWHPKEFAYNGVIQIAFSADSKRLAGLCVDERVVWRQLAK